MQSHYLVIGAGSAGVVLTRRLLDAGNKVTLVEAGGQDTNADIDDVSRLGMLWGGAEDWNYFTTPQPQLNDRRVHVPRGKVMGGSHALNATIWVRGDRWDFDTWAEQGCQGWSWDDVLPFYKAIENFHAEDGGGGDPQVHGTQGAFGCHLRLSPPSNSAGHVRCHPAGGRPRESGLQFRLRGRCRMDAIECS